MSKGSKKPVARKLNVGKKTIRRLSEDEVKNAVGGMLPTYTCDGGTGDLANCATGMRCCANHNQALRRRAR